MKLRTTICMLFAALVLFGLSAGAVAAQEKPVTFVDFSWDSVLVHNRIAAYIMEEGYGRKTDSLFAESLPGMMGIERGDADLSMEGWVDNILEFWTKATESGKMVSLGTNFPDAPQGWYVPTYVIKGDPKRGIEPMAPDLKSVMDLPKYWELFKDRENPKKGRFYNRPAGWKISSVYSAKIKSYGLDDTFEVFSPGSDTALATAMKRAYDQGKPILAYYWEPTWIMGILDMTRLEEPAFDQKLWEEEDVHACAAPAARVLVVANGEFVKKNPDLAAFLSNYSTTLQQTNRFLAEMVQKDLDARQTAIWFLKNNPDVWKSWIPADAEGVVEKVETALKGEKI